MKRTLGCVALFGWLMSSGSLQAHHSLAGVYDMKAEKELKGTVEKVQFVNPHGSLTISVKNPDATDNRVGFHIGLGHGPRAEGGWENRAERPPYRG